MQNKTVESHRGLYWAATVRWALTIIAVSLLVGCFWVSAQDGVFSREWGQEPFLYILATLQYFVHYLFTGTADPSPDGHAMAATMLVLSILTGNAAIRLWGPANAAIIPTRQKQPQKP